MLHLCSWGFMDLFGNWKLGTCFMAHSHCLLCFISFFFFFFFLFLTNGIRALLAKTRPKLGHIPKPMRTDVPWPGCVLLQHIPFPYATFPNQGPTWGQPGFWQRKSWKKRGIAVPCQSKTWRGNCLLENPVGWHPSLCNSLCVWQNQVLTQSGVGGPVDYNAEVHREFLSEREERQR